jgi:hypothetical protein
MGQKVRECFGGKKILYLITVLYKRAAVRVVPAVGQRVRRGLGQLVGHDVDGRVDSRVAGADFIFVLQICFGRNLT